MTTASWARVAWMMGAGDDISTYNRTADNGVADDEVDDNGIGNNNNDYILDNGALGDGRRG